MSRTAFQIHNDEDYKRALTLLDELWEAEPGSLEERVLDIMATRIAAYEAALRASEWSEAGFPAKGESPTMHLCKVVLKVDAGEMDLKDVIAMLDRTRNNIIGLEAIGDSPQALPMPESKIPK